MPASRPSNPQEQQQQAAVSTSLEREAAALKRALPFLQRCGVPCTSDTKLVSQAARQALKAVMVSGEAAASVVGTIVGPTITHDPEMQGCIDKLRLASANAAEHRERNASISNSRSVVVASADNAATGAVRMQCWAAVFTALDAALGVAVPRDERELLLTGDVFAALDLVVRLEPVVAAAARDYPTAPEKTQRSSHDEGRSRRSPKKKTSSTTEMGMQTGMPVEKTDGADATSGAEGTAAAAAAAASRTAEAEEIVARAFDARVDQRAMALEAKVARLEAAIAQQQQHQQQLQQLAATQHHEHHQPQMAVQSTGLPKQQPHLTPQPRQRRQSPNREAGSSSAPSSVPPRRQALPHQQHCRGSPSDAPLPLEQPRCAANDATKRGSCVPPPPPPDAAAAAAAAGAVGARAAPSTAEWSREDDERLAAAPVKLRRSVRGAAATRRTVITKANEARHHPTQKSTETRATKPGPVAVNASSLAAGRASPNPGRVPGASKNRTATSQPPLEALSPPQPPPAKPHPDHATIPAPTSLDAVSQRLAMRRKEDERRAALVAAAAADASVSVVPGTRVATVEDAVRVVQRWLASRATALTLQHTVEPRQRAATLLQLFLRHRLAIRARRRRLGRSSGAREARGGVGGCCGRCAVVLDALATRLAADPLLAPAAVRRFANAWCPLEKSPACRAAVLALIE